MSLESAPDVSVSQASATPRPTVRNKPPITAHPWFPGIVAVWLAATLGLSSLVIAQPMLERLVAASGIPTLVAAAAPPLGQTARLLLTLGLSGLGGIVGLILGSALAPRSRRPAAAARAADHGGTEAPAGVGSTAEPEGLRDRLARLTGQGDGPRDFDDLPRLRARDRHPDAPGCKPLRAEDVAAAEELVLEARDDPAPVTAPAPASAPTPAEVGEDMTDRGGDAAAPVEAGSPAGDVAPDERGTADPVVADQQVQPTTSPVSPPPPAPVPAAVAALKSAPLDTLGVVQLTERLAISMRERRQRDVERAESGTGAGAGEDAPVAMPPLALLRRMRDTLAGPGTDPADGAAPDAAAPRSAYSSLLDLPRKADQPHRPPFAQVVPGPFWTTASLRSAHSQASREPAATSAPVPDLRDPAENYRALKAALASLQQISGTR